MQRFFAICSCAAVTMLAACGGGAGSPGPGPVPIPSSTPISYSASLRFVGVLAGQMQSALRAAQAVSPMAQSTPIPIMLVSPMTAQNNIGSEHGSAQGLVEAVVSPLPVPSNVPVTFANTDVDASVGPTPTPLPSQTPMPFPTGVIAENLVVADVHPQVQSAGVATATIGNPINQQPQTNVYVYLPISIECQNPLDPGSASAWNWNGSAWVAASAPSDVYVSCSGKTPSTQTLNIPGGFTTFSTDTPFSALSTSQWANTYTSEDFETLATLNPDGSANTEIVAKTADGKHIFKMFPYTIDSYPGEYSGAVEVSGAGVDGF